MAFPWNDSSRLRKQILIALGSTGLMSAAALGCTSRHASLEPRVAGAGAGGRAGTGVAGRAAGGAGAAGMTMLDASLPVGGAGRDAAVSACNGRGERTCFVPSALQQLATFGCGQIAISPTPTSEQVAAKFLPNGCLKQEAACNSCCNPATSEGELQPDGSCCYTFCSTFCCGRPFLIGGEPRLAAVELRSDWSSRSPGADATAASALADRIASEWLEDARMEHASIASFARFTIDLLAVGAPSELVELAQRAALDEVEHARLCFGLATRYSGIARGPAPLSAAGVQVAASLWDAALAAFHEGCVGETIAALQARAALEQAHDPDVRQALERIADDEARHAELAWRFVAWTIRRMGAELGAELKRELAGLLTVPARVVAESEPPEVLAALHAGGRLTAGERECVAREGLRTVVGPCLSALVALSPDQDREALDEIRS